MDYEVIAPEGNGWAESQRYVLAGIERLEKKTDCLDQKVGDLRVEVGRLKDVPAEVLALNKQMVRVSERLTLRATVVGVLAGAVPVAILVAFKVLR